MENTKRKFDVSSAGLHILAMLFMLSDHAWATIAQSQEWMTCVGRIAFPIFAFLIAEGYHHTGNFKKYILRMLVFALISEIPFNLMYGGSVIYPYHQNVLWTFIIALLGIRLVDWVKEKGRLWLTVLVAAAVITVGTLLGFLCMTDYYGFGVLMVFLFHFFRGRRWWCFLGQLAGMYFLNMELMGGYCYIVDIFGRETEIMQQSFALLALIPIWLYRGRQGHHSKAFKYFCYAFYPAHILLLVLISSL